MMFVTDWFYKKDGGWVQRRRVPERTEVRRLVNPPDPRHPYVEVVAPAQGLAQVCGEGVQRNFHVDARRVKRIRFCISDEEHEGSEKTTPRPGTLLAMQCPYSLRHAKRIHWSIETEE